jgi:hypothetical protein
MSNADQQGLSDTQKQGYAHTGEAQSYHVMRHERGQIDDASAQRASDPPGDTSNINRPDNGAGRKSYEYQEKSMDAVSRNDMPSNPNVNPKFDHDFDQSRRLQQQPGGSGIDMKSGELIPELERREGKAHGERSREPPARDDKGLLPQSAIANAGMMPEAHHIGGISKFDARDESRLPTSGNAPHEATTGNPRGQWSKQANAAEPGSASAPSPTDQATMIPQSY